LKVYKQDTVNQTRWRIGRRAGIIIVVTSIVMRQVNLWDKYGTLEGAGTPLRRKVEGNALQVGTQAIMKCRGAHYPVLSNRDHTDRRHGVKLPTSAPGETVFIHLR